MRHITFLPMLALAFMLTGAAAHAQTGTSTTGTGGADATVTTPGTPNTGAGGTAAENFVTLAATTAVIAAGGVYLMRTRRS